MHTESGEFDIRNAETRLEGTWVLDATHSGLGGLKTHNKILASLRNIPHQLIEIDSATG